MKTVFLAGGIGKRMFPLMEDKFLFKFLGKTLLEHHMETAASNGLDDFIVIGNPENIEKIKSAIEVNKILEGKKYRINYSIQKKPDGMADALMAAKDLIAGEEIVIVNPNDIFEKSAYAALMSAAKSADADSYILGQEVGEYFPGGYLIIDEKNYMKGIVEKPGRGNEPSNLVNIVVHYHRKTNELFKYLETNKSANDDVYESSMDRMIKEGFRFKVVRYTGVWKAIKYPWHMLETTKHFLSGVKSPMIHGTAKIAANAVIEGGVIIDAGARVMENAVVKGPCYIGKNSIIGNNSLVREYAHIGDNSVVGYSTEVKNSYIGDNCWFHTAYVGDCVIADNCSLAAGTIVTNVRLDEKDIKVNVFGKGDMSSGLDHLGAIMGENCRTGSNVTLMPGVRVGPNSVVGPGVVLREDLDPNKLIYIKQEQVIKENNVLPNSKKKEEIMKKLIKLEEQRKK
ncbi:MAG: NTP transferase domain-containing protein [Candidatus Aenigmarchaeota archaeon]|nr:NTP transferase domain-containing protein [Candidatus Aenigmarchaeota archaeon]